MKDLYKGPSRSQLITALCACNWKSVMSDKVPTHEAWNAVRLTLKSGMVLTSYAFASTRTRLPALSLMNG